MKRNAPYILLSTLLLVLLPFFSPLHAAVGDLLLKWNGGYSLHYPSGIAVDAQGNIYLADTNNNAIQVFSSAGTFIRKWGGSGSADGQFRYPAGIAIDGSGNVYVADTYNHRIQVFTDTGTFLRGWGSYGFGNGQFYLPSGIAVDGSGNVYVADTYNHRIQVFTGNGIFLRKWGNYGSGDSQFYQPSGIAVDGSGNVYVSDTNNHRIQVFTDEGVFLRKWGSPGIGDGQFNSPAGIAIDSNDNVYVSDTNNHRIQVFTGEGVFLRKWGSRGEADGRFNSPAGVAIDSNDNVYMSDTNNHRIQVFTGEGVFSRKWGSQGSWDGQFKYPRSIALDGSDNVYVVDTNNHRIQVFTGSGTFLREWGEVGTGDGQFNYPSGIAIDGNGNVYVADTNNHRIQVFTGSGTFLRKWGGTGSGEGKFRYPSGIAFDRSGSVYVADTFNHRIQAFTSIGTFLREWGGMGAEDGQFKYPYGIAIDGSGSVYVADTFNHRIQAFTRTGAFQRKWGSLGSDDGQFNYPYGITVDGNGNLYVADTNNRRVGVFSDTGILLRQWSTYSRNDARFNSPQSLASDKCGGRIYVVDANNHRVLVFAEYGTPVTTNIVHADAKKSNWWMSDVAVSFNVSGGCGTIQTWFRLNGIEAQQYRAPFTISKEGMNTLEYWSTAGGFEENHKTSNIAIDKTPPQTIATLSGEQGNNGWYLSDVQVVLFATDTDSGLEKLEYSIDDLNWHLYTSPFMITAEGVTTVFYRSMDLVGNIKLANTRVKIDRVPPALTWAASIPPNEKGWYKTNVTIHFMASDSGSGVDTITPDTTISTEGTNQSVTGMAIDNAGNSANILTGGINIDKTPPQITVIRPVSEYVLNQDILAEWAPADALSGVSYATGTLPSGRNIDTRTVGANGFSVMAMDNAGNRISRTETYHVRYSYSGILQPINSEGNSLFKLGSAIPVKFQLSDNKGNNISTAAARIDITKISDNVIGDEVKAAPNDPPTTGNLFKYKASDKHYIFNLDTKTLSPGAWQIKISLDDGTSKYATVSLK